MEGLNNMLKTVNQNGWLRGFRVPNNAGNEMEVSHLLYVDDTLVLCEAKAEQMRYLRLILIVFEFVSGLHVNWRKSRLIPVKEVADAQVLAGILGCEIDCLPTAYLGLSLGSRNKVMEVWSGVVERVERRLARWKTQYLSLGGRVILINVVLDSLPTYVMSLFPIPAKVEKRFNNENQALWKEVVINKYGQQGQWCTKPVTTAYAVSVWRSIRAQWPTFNANVGFTVGNRRKISFWNDNWLGYAPLKDMFPHLFCLSLVSEASIGDTWSLQGWNLYFRRSLNDWEVIRVTELLKDLDTFNGTSHNEDSMIWKSDGKDFTVKSVYTLLNSTGHQNTSWP
ncbi:uncharacterized protein [Nicotiana tomentosiformis]|uniref:uncharacterized protein n=1 Tax=Nicotiana tomentosiformis TaxID=4098 RepID=UPI00388C7BBA